YKHNSQFRLPFSTYSAISNISPINMLRSLLVWWSIGLESILCHTITSHFLLMCCPLLHG
uniref:Uncharacterized protein n=1 Tax=Aegilops tauschii subsp. strangulata TaxID=200361 RepID=A0A453FUI1_AEGTS